MPSISPPRARPVQYKAPLGTRWEKEKANVPRGAFDLVTDPRQIGPWILGECVGKGASGRVKVARHVETGQMAAVKILPLEHVLSSRHSLNTRASKAEKHRNGIDKEIIMMKLMDHPNIVRIYDVFEGERDLFLILEYVDGGELFDYLVNNGRMEPPKALYYFKQIIYGLSYAHAFSVIHRDLKPENILIASLDPPHIKIADWGMAAFAPPEHCLETSCGSPHYASPEIVRGERYSGTATDIWSCGVILFALMTGRLPFDDKSIRILLQKVKSGKYEIPTYVHQEAADLIRRMLVVDVEKRIKMHDILIHPFLSHGTPGIDCPPAPSISELDKPLRSRALIKQDLIRSLLLICAGATSNELITELLSPPGQGSLIKALYFLLSKHRERTLEEYGMQSLFFNDGQNIKHYAAPPLRESDTPRLLASRLPPTPPMPVYTPERCKISDAQASSRACSRTRPASPIGPRSPPPSQFSRVRPTSSPAAPRSLSEGANSKDSENILKKAGLTSPCSEQRGSQRTQTIEGLPLSQQRYDPMFSSPTPGVPSGIPFPGSPRVQIPLPSLVPNSVNSTSTPQKPDVDDPVLKRTLDDVERNFQLLLHNQTLLAEKNVGLGLNAVNTPLKNGGSVNKPEEGRERTYPKKLQLGTANANTEFHYSLPNKKMVNLVSQANNDHDKENVDYDPCLSRERQSDEDGSFMKIDKSDVDFNMAEINTNTGGGKRIRARRNTSTSCNQKEGGRHVHRISEPSMAGAGALLSAPSMAVGEVKGWFANLFNWKAQQYVLHSVDNYIATRDEASRVLQKLGCQVQIEDAPGWGLLKCRMDETLGMFLPLSGHIV